MTTIAGSRVLVLGGSGGLGRALVAAFAVGGARVVSSGARDGVDPVSGAEVHVVGDITSSDDRERIVDAALEHLGGLDVVVLASGVVGFGSADTVRSADLQRLIDVDLTGPLAFLGLVGPEVSEGGSVVVLTGAIVDSPIPGTSAYAGAKAGLSSAAVVIGRELRRRKVTVIDARPPHTETGLADRAVFGAAPTFPAGLTADAVAARIVTAIEAGERELPPAAFTTGAA
ncbi:MAG: SDR family NAD(P)-dependent oxidoreductase [Ilumatobacteraceae bacterium]|jgi:cyclic-di-GMP-binding biofilm dispersal mediator protein